MKLILVLLMIFSQFSFCLAVYLKNFVPSVHSKIIISLFYGSYLISIVIYLFMFYKLIEYAKVKEEVKQMKQLKEIKQKQKESIEIALNEEKENKRKILLQIDEVIKAIDNQQFEQAKKVFSNIYDDFKSSSIQTYCDNAYINAIITSKKTTMNKYNIDFGCQISLPAIIPIDVLVLPTIVFNLLDNAISASKMVKDGFIYLKINYTNNYISIYLKNSNKKFENNEINGVHGYGMSIIEDLIKQYDGSCEWKDETDKFEAMLMLKYKEGE